MTEVSSVSEGTFHSKIPRLNALVQGHLGISALVGGKGDFGSQDLADKRDNFDGLRNGKDLTSSAVHDALELCRPEPYIELQDGEEEKRLSDGTLSSR